MTDLKSSLSFMNESVESLQKGMKDKVDAQVFVDFKEEMVKKTDDLENRSKAKQSSVLEHTRGRRKRHWFHKS